MFITDKQIDTSNFKICINQKFLSITDNVKYLGVYLDQDDPAAGPWINFGPRRRLIFLTRDKLGVICTFGPENSQSLVS